MNEIEIKIRYLESIQKTIDRLANTSFILKGWAVTLSAALLALASKDSNVYFASIVYLPVLFFWFLDSKYLQMERQFRVLYDKHNKIDTKIEAFDMNRPDKSKEDHTLYRQCLFSTTQVLVYLPILLTALLVLFFIIHQKCSI